MTMDATQTHPTLTANNLGMTPMTLPLGAPSAMKSRSTEGSYRILSRADRYELAAHLCSLSMPDRIERFHGGMSDAAVTAYALGIDWDEHWIAALAPERQIVAVVEIVSHPLHGWSQCEIVFSLPLRKLSLQRQAELTQLALLEASARGCESMTTVGFCEEMPAA